MVLGLTVDLLTSCKLKEPQNPLNNGTNIRNLILVISDMHLGDDDSYAQCVKNKVHLVNFLEQVRVSPNVKELVIAGDLFDEWFIPDSINTYRWHDTITNKGYDQEHFIKRIVENNKEVFNVLNGIIREGKILVTYTPGNHDLAVEASSVETALPGVNQARDEGLLGLGTYSPIDYPEIAIEHGHRYNFFCSPDPVSNQSVVPGTILPPGYFYTRLAATHLSGGCKHNVDSVPDIKAYKSEDKTQINLYLYWKMWQWAINTETTCKPFNEKSIVTNVNGFTQPYSVNDVLPYQDTVGGNIFVSLYNGIQYEKNWVTRCSLNHVSVDIPIEYAIKYANDSLATDTMAYWQYFNRPESQKRIVVFGHSHVARMKNNIISGKKYIYVNSGTWIDTNPLSGNGMNVVIITPQGKDLDSYTHVRLYNFDESNYKLVKEDSLKL